MKTLLFDHPISQEDFCKYFSAGFTAAGIMRNVYFWQRESSKKKEVKEAFKQIEKTLKGIGVKIKSDDFNTSRKFRGEILRSSYWQINGLKKNDPLPKVFTFHIMTSMTQLGIVFTIGWAVRAGHEGIRDGRILKMNSDHLGNEDCVTAKDILRTFAERSCILNSRESEKFWKLCENTCGQSPEDTADAFYKSVLFKEDLIKDERLWEGWEKGLL